jgi:membrane fusion protein (multidrug efflux system)
MQTADARWAGTLPVVPKRRGSLFRSVSVGLMGAAIGLTGCSSGEQQQQASEPPAVGVIEVAEQQVNPFFEFVGKIRAAETVALRARVTGFLEERSFQEGGVVEQGQVLFKIEPQQYQATLAQAEAELAAANASLNRAQVDLARYKELVKAKNVSQQKVDEAEAEVLVQEATVQTAKANIEKAQLNVDYTQVVAPIGGRIDLAAFDVGNLIGPESGVLATINRMDPIKVAFSIAETWYLELVQEVVDARRQGMAVDEFTHVPLVRLPDGSLYEYPGRFDFIDNKVDEKTGTVLIHAEFENPDRILLPGQFVTVVIERKEAIDAVMISQAAVLTDQGGAYVLLVNDEDKVEARRITTGQRFGPNLVVSEGLKTGERVILYGVQKVRPGLTVRPELSEPPSDPMASATDAFVMAEETSGPEEGNAEGIDTDTDTDTETAEGDAPEGEEDPADQQSPAAIETSAEDRSGGEQKTPDETQ